MECFPKTRFASDRLSRGVNSVCCGSAVGLSVTAPSLFLCMSSGAGGAGAGYEKYNSMRADPALCFLERVGMPDAKAIAAEQRGTDMLADGGDG